MVAFKVHVSPSGRIVSCAEKALGDGLPSRIVHAPTMFSVAQVNLPLPSTIDANTCTLPVKLQLVPPTSVIVSAPVATVWLML